MDNQHNPNNTPTCNGISAHDKKISFLVAEDHGQRILTVLQSFRAQNIFFDFKILVKDEAIPCHRCVLAACSDFFRAMFEVNMKERDDGSVTISNLTPKAVKAFLDYAYTGKTEITNDNVEMFFQLSSFLQISLLSKACSDFLIKNIDLVNCLQLLSISESYGSTKLFEHALKYAQMHFSLLLQSNDLLEMNFEILQKCIEADELNVPDEESVLKAAFWWTKHDLETRHKYLLHLMKKIRLHQLPEKTLQDILLSEEQFLKATNCLVIIKEAIQNVQSFSGLFPDPRPSTTEKYILVHKTEENKIDQHTFCYNIKTDQWKELMNINIFDLPGSSLSSYGEKIFITGGCKGNCFRTIRLHIAETFHDATDQTWCYCPANDSFSLVSAMKKPRTMHTSVVTLNRLYVIGGKTRASQDIKSLLDVEAYNPVSREWKSVSPLPRGIYYPEASACHSVIYVLGSEVEITDAFNPSLDCFFKYNAATDQWSQLVAEFGQFFHATLIKAIPVNCTLYICDLSTYKVYSFCPETCVWKGEGSFECAGFNAGAVGIEDKIYILGGDYAPDEITDEVQVYHSSRSEWEEVAPMPKALTEFHCQVIQFNKFRDPWLQKQCDTNNYTRRSDLVAATATKSHVVTPKSSSPSTSSIRRMKKVKKILGLGRKNEQQSPSRSRVVACASAPGALPVRPVTCPKHVHVEDCMNVSLKATRKSENKRQNSKQKVSQQLSNNLHQPQDESSLSEASLEERYPAKSVSGKNKLYRTLLLMIWMI